MTINEERRNKGQDFRDRVSTYGTAGGEFPGEGSKRGGALFAFQQRYLNGQIDRLEMKISADSEFQVNINPVQEVHLNHVSRLKWINEMEKLQNNHPPYDCDDDEAMRRFEGILKASEKRERIRIQNKNQYEET